MLDITLSNFERDVIEASRRQPVLLDIWAPWCGPCKSLGPVLERLEVAYSGRFALAKLNSDEQPEIAAQLSTMFGVRSIPFCVLFKQGEPVDGFVGALPESELRAFLDKTVPAAELVPEEETTDRACEMPASGQPGDTIATLRRALEKNPSDDEARFRCLHALIQAGRLVEAHELYAPVAGRANAAADDLAAAGLWLEACTSQDDVGAISASASSDGRHADSGATLEARFQRAWAHLARSKFTAALDELLEILARDKSWNGGQARATYLAILRLLRADERLTASQSGISTPREVTSPSAQPTIPNQRSVADSYHRRLSMTLF